MTPPLPTAVRSDGATNSPIRPTVASYCFCCALVWAILAAAATVKAAVIPWANVGTDFATGTNWTGGNAPVDDTTTDIASFGTAATFLPDLAANRSVAGVRFANGAGAFTFTGTASPVLTLGASGVENLDPSLQTLDASLGLRLGTAAPFTVSSSGALAVASAVDTDGNALTLAGASSGAGTVSGIISGSGALTKSGTNTWTLSAANSFTGTTTISGGTLVVPTLADGGADSGIGASGNAAANLTIDGGTLRFTGTSAQTTDRLFTLGLAGGTLDASGTTATNTIAFTNAGSLAYSGSGARTLTLTGTNTGTNSLAAVIADNGGATALTKTGAGTWALSGTNTYSGATTVAAGTLAFDSIANADGTASALGAPTSGATGTVALGSGTSTATLLYTGAGHSSDRAFGLAGTTGGGTITHNGSGALLLSGDLTASVAGAKTFTLGGTNTAANVFSGIVSDGTGTVSVAKAGAGTWELAGANTYTGNTTVSAGTLLAGNNSAFGSGTVILSSGATLAGDGTARILANNVLLGGSATLGGSSDLTFSGTLTQNNTSTVFTVSNTGATVFGAVDISNGTDRTLQLTATGGTVTVTGIVADGGTSTASNLTKAGSGTLVLQGANTYGGITSILAGTLRAENAAALGDSTAANAVSLTGGTLSLASDVATDFSRNVSLGGTAAITVDRLTAGAGLTHTLGNLTTASATLSIQPGANLTAGTAYGLTFGDVTLAGNPVTLNVANNGAGTGTLTLGALTNAAARGITKAGDGTLFLGAAAGAIFSGTDITVNAGTLRLGAADALGSSALADIVVNHNTGGTALFDLNGYNQSVLTLTFGGTGGTSTSVNTLSTGAGTLTLGGTVTGNATGNPLGATLSGNVDLGAATRTFAIADSVNTSAELTVSAALAGSGVGLTKTGTGALVLSGTNTYTGTTLLSSGTLRAESDAAALGAGTLTIDAATLQLAGDTGVTFGRNTSIIDNVTLQSDRVTAGTGVMHTLGTLATGTFTHTVSAGSNVSGGTAGIAFGATTLAGSPIFNVGAGAELSLGALADGGVARSITKSGAGTLALTSAAASWATAGDSLVVSGGTVRLDAANAFGTGTNTALTVRDTLGGTALLDLNGHNQSFGNITLGGTGGLAASVNNISTGTGSLTLGGTFTSSAVGVPTSTWTVSGNLVLAAGTRTFNIADSAGITGTAAEVAITANISGAGNLTKATGTGTLVLSGTNTYSGNTTLSAGTLRATNATALGAGNLSLGGGTLDLVNDSATNFGRNTTLTANTTVRADTATAVAGVTHTLGTLSAAAATMTVQAGPTVSANTAYGLTFGSTTLTGNATLSVANNGAGLGTVTLGALSNAAVRGLTKTGDGTLVLSAASGAISSGSDFAVRAGTLRLDASNALGASALVDMTVNKITTGGTALLDLNGYNQSLLTLVFGGTGGTATSVNNVSTGAGTLTLGGSVTYSATGNPLGSTLSGNVNLGNALRTFTIADSTNTTSELTVSANLSGAGGGISKGGAGHLILAGTNTQTGNTTVSAGSLTVNTGASLAAATANLTVNVGSLNLNNAAQTVGIFSGNGTVNLGTGHAFTANQTANSSFTGTITGTDASLAKLGTGTLTLSGSNSYSGTTTIAGGTMSANTLGNVGGGPSALGAPTTAAAGTIAIGSGANAGALTYTGLNTTSDRVIDLAGTTGGATLTTNGNLTLTSAFTATGAGDKTLTLQGTATASAISGAIVDHSATDVTALVKAGTGTWTLSGANTFSGAVAIQRGTLAVTSLNRVVGGTASSSLGAPTTAADGTIAFGSTTVGGVLAYSGTGETTDRVIALAGTTGGGVIDSSGSGGLIFTSALTVTGIGNKTLTLQGSATGNEFAGAIVNYDSLNLTAVTKAGTGTWTLSGSNTYTGTTTVNEGTLRLAGAGTAVPGALAIGNGTGTATVLLQAADRIAATSAVTLNAAGTPTLDLAGYAQTLGSLATTNTGAVLALGSPGAATAFTVGDTTSTTFAGAISGGANAAFVKQGTGTLTLAGANTFDGLTTVAAGALSLQNNTGLGSTAAGTVVDPGAALHLNNTFSGNLTVGAEALTLNGTGLAADGALRNVAGNNSLAGTVTLAAAAQIDSAADTLTLSGAVTAANFDLTVGGSGNLSLTGNLNLGSGDLVKNGSGTLTLSGSTVGVDAVTLNGGTLAVGGSTAMTAGAVAAAAGTTLTIASGGTLTADYAAGTTTFSGALAGAGTFVKTGTGTLAFDQTFDASGLTLELAGGTLSLAGGIGVTLGTLHITGDTILDFNNSAGTFLSSAALVIEAGVTITVNNWITVSGDALSSTVWYATGTVNGGSLGAMDQVGGTPLNQIFFTSYDGLTTTWVSGSHDGWFNREIRPTPEPAVTGAAVVAASLALLAWRRRRAAAVSGIR